MDNYELSHKETTVIGLLSAHRPYGFIFSFFTVIGCRITHFPFSHILRPQTPRQISEMQDMIAQSSVQNKFVLVIPKIVPFWNGRYPIESGVKMTQNVAVFDPL